jgi:hypothetical protein
LSRRGCSAEKAALGVVAPAMIADMTTPPAIAACAGAVLGIDFNVAIMVLVSLVVSGEPVRATGAGAAL